jgi:hypothetical protein
MIDSAALRETDVYWLPSFLEGLRRTGDYTTWLLLGAIAVWGLFEWRVHSENKSFMRLSALGTAAVGLMVAVALTAASLILPFLIAMPAFARISAPLAAEQMASIDTSVSAIERAIPKKDWEAMQENADRASGGVDNLARMAFAIWTATSGPQKPTVEELQARLNAAKESLREAQQAIQAKDTERLQAAVRAFRKSYGPVREAAIKPER